MASALVSIDMKLQGPSLSPSAACASGAHAIADAALLIRDGAADRLIDGGAESCMHELALFGFAQCKALSTIKNPEKASCPWSAQRSGFIMVWSETSAIAMIKLKM